MKSREAPKQGMKILDEDEQKQAATVKVFSSSEVHEESAIEISSQIKKQLAELPKPSSSDRVSPTNTDSNLGPQDEQEDDMQLPTDLNMEDVSEMDIDENFIRMIEESLNNKTLDHDLESGTTLKNYYLYIIVIVS